MNLDVLVPAIITGLLSGAAILLPTLAVALIYQHGRYVPLWLPDLGVLGAFVVHALWTHGIPGPAAVCVALSACVILAWLIHQTLIRGFLLAHDRLSPLLVGIGLSQIFQAIVSLYGEGMSQHFPDTFLRRHFYSDALGTSIYSVDVAFFGSTVIAMLLLHLFLRFTHLGLRVRAVIANSELAAVSGLPVQTVNLVLLAIAAILVAMGTIMRGVRYDLQPSMMFYPGLGAIVACIVAEPGRRITALCVVLAIEIVAAIVGTFPTFSPFQRGVPFVVLLAYLAWRSVYAPSRAAEGMP